MGGIARKYQRNISCNLLHHHGCLLFSVKIEKLFFDKITYIYKSISNLSMNLYLIYL